MGKIFAIAEVWPPQVTQVNAQRDRGENNGELKNRKGRRKVETEHTPTAPIRSNITRRGNLWFRIN